MDQELFSSLIATIQAYGVDALVSLGSLVAGGWFGFWRARRQWERREFLERINLSLNTIQEGRLLIRTLAELPLSEVFTNRAALLAVERAIHRTTPDNPIPPLPEAELWPTLNCVLNLLSERFSEGHLRRDLGHSVRAAPYLVCLTREHAEGMRTSKVRAMVCRKDMLLDLPAEEPAYEHPNHRVRFRTLLQLADAYRRDPRPFIEVELCQ